jgi:hypothetical protein
MATNYANNGDTHEISQILAASLQEAAVNRRNSFQILILHAASERGQLLIVEFI